jgi:hypothetical protein
MPPEGDLSLSFQVQGQKLGNPYQVQAEMGLTKWFEIAIFKGFEPNELIFGTEIGLRTKEPYLLAIGFSNWSPHSHVDPQPTSRPVIGESTTSSPRAWPMSIFVTKQSSGMPMILMIHGGRSWIFRAALEIHPRLDLCGALATIVRSIRRSMSPTIVRTKCSVMCRSLTRFTSGAAENEPSSGDSCVIETGRLIFHD